MTEYCQLAGLPKPNYQYEDSDFTVEFRKDIYYPEFLMSLGLNERQIKAVLYTKENERITNNEYQEINKVSKSTASRELLELSTTYNLLSREGSTGVGTYYKIIE
jgi:ATP-dependent DNA helicase RecG